MKGNHFRGKIGKNYFELGLLKWHSPGFGFSKTGWFVSIGFFFLSFNHFSSFKKHLKISFHDGSLWIDPWIDDDHCFGRALPWYRKIIILHFEDWLKGKLKYENIEEEAFQILIPMSEGCYRATAKKYHSKWWRTRWLYKKEREGYYIEIEGGIPFCGKGENSYDCGDDGLCAISCEGTIEEGIGKVVTSVLENRRRYGEIEATKNKIVYA